MSYPVPDRHWFPLSCTLTQVKLLTDTAVPQFSQRVSHDRLTHSELMHKPWVMGDAIAVYECIVGDRGAGAMTQASALTVMI